MEITESFVLPKDVVATPVASLSAEERRRLEADDDDFVLTRMRGRGHSKVVDAGMAKLMERFREASRSVAAVIGFSEEIGSDPEDTLEAAYPILRRLIRANLLVAEGSKEAEPVEASLHAGDDWDGLTLVRMVQLLEDSEIHQARTGGGAL